MKIKQKVLINCSFWIPSVYLSNPLVLMKAKSAGMQMFKLWTAFMTQRLHHSNPTEWWLRSQCVHVMTHGFCIHNPTKAETNQSITLECDSETRVKCVSKHEWWGRSVIAFTLYTYETACWAFLYSTHPGNYHTTHESWTLLMELFSSCDGEDILLKYYACVIHKKSRFLQTCCLFFHGICPL